MATNQILHAVDEIINGTPKYTITPNGDGTNGIVLANEVVQNGTPYNKNILDKIDNVLSYLTPSIEKTGSIVEKTAGNILASSITPTWTGETQNIGETIKLNLATLGNFQPEIIYTTNKYFSSMDYSNVDWIMAYTYLGSAVDTSEAFLHVEKYTTKTSDFGNTFIFGGQNSDWFAKTYDMKTMCKPTFKYYVNYGQYLQTCIIEVSDNGNDWTQDGTIIWKTNSTYTPTSKHRYFRFKFINSNIGVVSIAYMYIDSIIYDDIVFSNSFTLDNNTTFANNQRVLVETPSTTDLTGVTSNILNGIDIPTLLQPSTKYELIYKEDSNKFELGGLKTLFDITLTEAVNQVDLTGISNMLELGKLYELLIISKGLSSSGGIYFGDSISGYGDTGVLRNTMCLFTLCNELSGYPLRKVVRCISMPYDTSITATINTLITNEGVNQEYLKCNSTYTFNVGTRIIIKEVA